MNEAIISVVDSKALLPLFGPRDQHVRAIRKKLGVSISAMDGQIHVEGEADAVAQATEVLEQLQGHLNRHGSVRPSLIKRDSGMKDSSSWLPGFGGVLDLLDSLLVAAPVAYLFWASKLLSS